MNTNQQLVMINYDGDEEERIPFTGYPIFTRTLGWIDSDAERIQQSEDWEYNINIINITDDVPVKTSDSIKRYVRSIKNLFTSQEEETISYTYTSTEKPIITTYAYRIESTSICEIVLDANTGLTSFGTDEKFELTPELEDQIIQLGHL